jgi:hypothetical protein
MAKVNAPWKRVRVASWADFQRTIEDFLDGKWLFRGVTSVRHTLIPSVGRQREGYGYSRPLEDRLFQQFKREALPFLRVRPDGDWEWLALAQHHGVPTRLLDWSESPTVSLFFAVWGNDEDDAGLYIIPRPDEAKDINRRSPFDVAEVLFFYPGYVTPRLVSQRGLFTVHPKPDQPYDADGMQQIVIGRECKADFRRKLDASGVHHAAIYADLDGLSRRLIAIQGYRTDGAAAQFGAAPTGPAIERAKVLARSANMQPQRVETRKINPQDPQKGQWGGLPQNNGWEVTAEVEAVQGQDDWFNIFLVTKATAGSKKKRLTGTVIYYLHDTFTKPIEKVRPSRGEAKLKLSAYGAFTVGVFIEKDGTVLELDLAELTDAPRRFREQ